MTDRIAEIMARAFEVPLGNITQHSSQDNVENWDSIHHVKLIILLEREFDIEIPDDEVTNMISYKLIKTVVDELLRPQI
jgi:acyl carrier protein